MSKIQMKPATKPFQIPAPGQYPARICRIIEIGLQAGEFKGKASLAEKLLVSFELSGPRDSAGDLFVLQSEATNSLSELANIVRWVKAALRRDLTQDELAGNFDITAIMDKPVMVEVVHTISPNSGKTNARIEARSVTKLPPQLSAEPLETPIFELGFPPTAAEFATLTKWEQRKISESVGWSGPVA